MGNGNKITKKEHFIPQTLLSRFTIDGKNICRYDIVKNKQQDYIPIKSVCYEDYLYELKKDGKIIHPNFVEKKLGKVEKLLNQNIKKLEDCIKLGMTFKKDILSEEDKQFWIDYIILHMLRHPNSLKIGKQSFEDFGISKNDANNKAIGQMLPLLLEISKGQGIFIDFYKKLFVNAVFQIWYDDTESLFINEKSGSFISNNRYYYPLQIDNEVIRINAWKNIAFPLSKSLVLMIFNIDFYEDKNLINNNNVLRKISARERNLVQKNIAHVTNKIILSAKPLTKGQIKSYFNK